MPKFIITETMPTTITWVYEVEADNETDALEQILNGEVEAKEYGMGEPDYEKVEYDITEEEVE